MFLAAPNQGKLLADPSIFDTVDPRLFTTTQLITYKDKQWVVLPFDDMTHTLLARHDIKAPAPIEHFYKWPGRFKPFKHQLETAKFLATYDRCFCFNDIGTGKSNAALWAADYLMSQGTHKSAIIIAPLSTLERVWGDALFLDMHHRKYQIIYGSRARRLKLLEEPADFYVVNHDGLKIIKDALKQRPDISLAIVDEFAVYRNARTQLYASLWDTFGPDTGKSLWGLTGAPMPHGPTDLWGQARLINPNLVPRYFSRFRDEHMLKISNFKYVAKKGWEDACYKACRPSIRFTRDECLDLPPVTFIDNQTEMSKKQQQIYDAVFNHCVANVDDSEVMALNEGVKVNKLLQIATGAVYTSGGDTADLEPKQKLSVLIDLVDEANRKCIVYTPFRHSIAMIYKALKDKFSVKCVDGSVSAKHRAEIFYEFQHGDLEVLLAHPKCMAHGLTLTASSTIIWYSPIDDFEIYEQANGRIIRAGQTQKQTIINLYCSDIERRVYARLREKEKMQGVLLDLLKQR
jgi:hypothetical protein